MMLLISYFRILIYRGHEYLYSKNSISRVIFELEAIFNFIHIIQPKMNVKRIIQHRLRL